MAVRLVLAALLGLAAALWTAERPGDPALFPPAPGAARQTVHLVDNGFHTDLVLPRAMLATGEDALAQAVRAAPPGDWLYVGWGDAVFYVEEGPISARLADGARAFFRPGGNPSVVKLEAGGVDPARLPQGAGRLSIALSPDGLQALRAHIGQSLKTDARGRPILATRRPGDGAVFFAGRDVFWIGRLCNHWTAEALNAAGLPMPLTRAVTSGQVMRAARRAEQTAAELDLGGAGD
ncbi:hypothetical protein D3C73_698740 [compost metagenome]